MELNEMPQWRVWLNIVGSGWFGAAAVWSGARLLGKHGAGVIALSVVVGVLAAFETWTRRPRYGPPS